MEHPHGADSWKTGTMVEMKGYVEPVCDRCRTGLYYKDDEIEGVRKQMRIRTSSRKVAEATDLACFCSRPHVQMEGKTQKLQAMQNYETGFLEEQEKPSMTQWTNLGARKR